MDHDRIRKTLFRRYLAVLGPAGAVLAAWAAYRNLIATPPPLAPDIAGPLAFIGAVATAVALPIFMRDRFVKRVAGLKAVDPETFLAFEKNLLTVGLASAYFAAAAYVCSATLFHFAGSFLAALYAAYYYFPSRARVAFETRMFRVPEGAG